MRVRNSADGSPSTTAVLKGDNKVRIVTCRQYDSMTGDCSHDVANVSHGSDGGFPLFSECAECLVLDADLLPDDDPSGLSCTSRCLQFNDSETQQPPKPSSAEYSCSCTMLAAHRGRLACCTDSPCRLLTARWQQLRGHHNRQPCLQLQKGRAPGCTMGPSAVVEGEM